LILKHGSIIKVVEQDLPFVGGAVIKGFQTCSGKYCLIMASDLETDPRLVKNLISEIQAKDFDIVTASRWIEGGGFENYNPIKQFCNKVFQKFFGILYKTELTDMTYGFRIFKTDIVQSIDWQELKHPLFFETLLKPIKLGYKVSELPAQWQARQEGESQICITDYFGYFEIGFKTLFFK
jgi:glycosyltransferase involved in cell wall biosynthesis